MLLTYWSVCILKADEENTATVLTQAYNHIAAMVSLKWQVGYSNDEIEPG